MLWRAKSYLLIYVDWLICELIELTLFGVVKEVRNPYLNLKNTTDWLITVSNKQESQGS